MTEQADDPAKQLAKPGKRKAAEAPPELEKEPKKHKVKESGKSKKTKEKPTPPADPKTI